MVLNKNPDNHFTENEMVAFNPALMPPGITNTDDKLMQSRLFAYSDAQRYRLGANYLLLPVNAPKNVYHNNHFDGLMNMTSRHEEENYFQSTLDKVTEAPKPPTPQVIITGKREKAVIPKENNFQQAGERFRSFDKARQARFVKNLVMWLSHSKTTPEIRRIWVGYWTQCDKDLGSMITKALQAASAEM
jgi:catalase